MISVIIPTHNRIEDLKKALNSVFTQTVLPSEVIVVDDGSLPAVPETIFDEAPVAIKTLLLRNEQPKGAPNARNRGINAATGEWIAFLDDDDEFFPEKIEVVMKTIQEKGHDIDLIYHSAQVTMVNEGIRYISKPKKFRHDEDMFRVLLQKNYIGGTSMAIVKKSSLIKVGYFDEALPALQDYELWLRMSQNNAVFYYLDKVLTKYLHITCGNSITNAVDSGLQAVEIIEKKYSEEYSRLSKSELRLHEIRKHNRKIRVAYFNKRYLSAIRFNAMGFLKFRELNYVAGFFASLFGPSFIFWLRSKESHRKHLR